MINVLINAYAVSPIGGSEPGVGWNWIVNIAKYCKVFVITESQWEEEIIKEVSKLPYRENIEFYFNPVSDTVRTMCWNQGDWRFYRYYREWQKKSLKIALDIVNTKNIDIIHQLNMIGFREPGYLWKISGIPFVWGPIGNMAPLKLQYLQGSSLKEYAKIILKNAISFYQARSGRVRKAFNRADCIFSTSEINRSIINKIYGITDSILFPETGLKVSSAPIHESIPETHVKLLWVGRFISTKKLDWALEILSVLGNKQDFELHIVGWGTPHEEKYYKEYSKKLGVASQCIWHGKIDHKQVQLLMQKSDLLLFTSVMEGTPHVVLEAISNNLPIVCYDVCGQGIIVDTSIGWKIPLSTKKIGILQMAAILNEINLNRSIIKDKSASCSSLKNKLSWEFKMSQVVEYYNKVLESYKS